MQFRLGDIGFIRPKKLNYFSRRILFYTRHRGEQQSEASHTFVFKNDSLIVEALVIPGVVLTDFNCEYVYGDKYEIIVFRPSQITPSQLHAIDGKLAGFIGRGYSLGKILTQWGDGLLGKISGRDIWFFRKAAGFSSRYVICSFVTGVIGSIVGLWPSKIAKGASPDDLLDLLYKLEQDRKAEVVFETKGFKRNGLSR